MNSDTAYSVEDILIAQGKEIKRRTGDQLIVDCWFCTPPDTKGHLYFHSVTGVFYCHKCHQSGNLFTLGWLKRGDDEDWVGKAKDTQAVDEVFNVAAKYYQRRLTGEYRDYWRQRGLADETIESRCLGYASGGLREHLEREGLNKEVVAKTGLIQSDGRDFFFRCLTIPYLESGRVVTIRARCLPGKENAGAKYLTLPGDDARIFNRDALRKMAESHLICEGEIDTMIAAQLGFSAVGIPGAGSFKEEWADAFPDNLPITAILDADNAGKAGIARIVDGLGPLVRTAELPGGLDVNDYILAGHSKEDLSALIEEARPWLDTEIERVTNLTEPARMHGLRELFARLSQLDPLQRPGYEHMISKQFRILIGDVREQVSRATKEKLSPNETAESKPQLSLDEQSAAEELLSDEHLVDRFLDDAEKVGLVGEEDNKVMLLLAFTSRISATPINTVVKGESSGGKSHLVQGVIRFMPPEDVKEFTALSPKALYHIKDSLAHKVVVIYERHGAEDADYSIRSLQSEGKLIFAMPVKDQETNRFETEEIEVQGPVGFVETTTRSHLHPENETRCFDLYIDDSSDQTRQIFAQQRKKYLGEVVDSDQVVRLWQNAQRLLKPYKVLIPFIDLIDFPDKPIRVRRDHQRFLTLIEAVCLLHQRQREIKTIHGLEYLVATPDDYAVAYELAGKVLLQTLKNLSPSAEACLAKIREFLANRSHGSDENPCFIIREIEAYTGIPNSSVRRYIKECVSAGYLEQDGSGQGRTARYRYLTEPKVAGIGLTPPKELERKYLESNATGLVKSRQMQLETSRRGGRISYGETASSPGVQQEG